MKSSFLAMGLGFGEFIARIRREGETQRLVETLRMRLIFGQACLLCIAVAGYYRRLASTICIRLLRT